MADNSGLPPVPISELLGGMLIMVCGSFVLYGVTNAQVYSYFLNCEGDSKWMKYLVGVTWWAFSSLQVGVGLTELMSRVIETAHTAFVLRILYYLVIISFGNGESLAKIDWSLLASTQYP
ncbi:hypothetical protein QCA50_002644 [Cerrena zonata]|uniref:Uncharacterized protein n=1 Tax=Cerrena zonata TaxID=2478898 RepID=A0AAW0GPU6_9APHY